MENLHSFFTHNPFNMPDPLHYPPSPTTRALSFSRLKTYLGKKLLFLLGTAASVDAPALAQKKLHRLRPPSGGEVPAIATGHLHDSARGLAPIRMLIAVSFLTLSSTSSSVNRDTPW